MKKLKFVSVITGLISKDLCTVRNKIKLSLLSPLTLQRGVTSTARHSQEATCRGVTSTARHAALSHSFDYISTTNGENVIGM